MRAIFIMEFEQGDATKRYPYNSLEDWEESGHYDEALDELNASRKDGDPHIPTFVQGMLERLKEVGLLHRTDIDLPSNVCKVPLDNKQDLWIRFDTRRNYDEGHMAVEVVDAPRSDTAILAAMVAWLARPVDFEQLLEATRFVLSGEDVDEIKRIGHIVASLRRITHEEPVIDALSGKMLQVILELTSFRRVMGKTEEAKGLTDVVFPRARGAKTSSLSKALKHLGKRPCQPISLCRPSKQR
jgi:hypothetical protein